MNSQLDRSSPDCDHRTALIDCAIDCPTEIEMQNPISGGETSKQPLIKISTTHKNDAPFFPRCRRDICEHSKSLSKVQPPHLPCGKSASSPVRFSTAIAEKHPIANETTNQGNICLEILTGEHLPQQSTGGYGRISSATI
jgi:hypothetical protein